MWIAKGFLSLDLSLDFCYIDKASCARESPPTLF
jgi:hypothetical protein